jgi:hypothetical protein
MEKLRTLKEVKICKESLSDNASHLPLGKRTINKESLKRLREAKLLCPEYNKLYQDIISVGEFNIQ